MVFYAVASVTGCLGQGLHELISFCAKQRSEWAGGLERQSLQAAFRCAWESRVLLTVARASFAHVQLALTKLLPHFRKKIAGSFRKTWDPLLNAGVFELRAAQPSAWGGLDGVGPRDSPFD